MKSEKVFFFKLFQRIALCELITRCAKHLFKTYLLVSVQKLLMVFIMLGGDITNIMMYIMIPLPKFLCLCLRL